MTTPWFHPNQAAINDIVQCQYDVANIRRALQFTREMAVTEKWPNTLHFSYETVMLDLTHLQGEFLVYKTTLWLAHSPAQRPYKEVTAIPLAPKLLSGQ